MSFDTFINPSVFKAWAILGQLYPLDRWLLGLFGPSFPWPFWPYSVFRPGPYEGGFIYWTVGFLAFSDRRFVGHFGLVFFGPSVFRPGPYEVALSIGPSAFSFGLLGPLF